MNFWQKQMKLFILEHAMMSTIFLYYFRKCRILRKDEVKKRMNKLFFYVYMSVPRNEEEEEIKHENQQQKQQSEPIFTISTLRRCSVYITHRE